MEHLKETLLDWFKAEVRLPPQFGPREGTAADKPRERHLAQMPVCNTPWVLCWSAPIDPVKAWNLRHGMEGRRPPRAKSHGR